MNAPHDNAETDRDALERYGADAETGELPWDGFRDGRIQNFLGLDWAGEKLRQYETGLAQNDAAHAEFLRRVEEDVAKYRARLLGRSAERLAELQAPLQRRADFFRAAIDAYAREVGRKGLCIGSQKSRLLPSGVRIGWRKEAGGYRWDQSKTPTENKAALLAWARTEEARRSDWKFTEPLVVPGPDMVDLDEVKRYLAMLRDDERLTVEIPPGLEYVPPGETLTISVDAKEEP